MSYQPTAPTATLTAEECEEGLRYWARWATTTAQKELMLKAAEFLKESRQTKSPAVVKI